MREKDFSTRYHLQMNKKLKKTLEIFELNLIVSIIPAVLYFYFWFYFNIHLIHGMLQVPTVMY